ncbi:bifunctional UDP-sugar hydrolase/5'-nucleotidase [Telmatospirillum sp. J64-1]|uniref:bifunctional metallophosphatase/5'-nucleotidase n=1 Tax=Telmatospirillum sp. J64-1 TaxID=2502183 RepID=UPI00115E75EC|nr:5'-nucleotidase C-terminal domain-containing protein [Telmatospirillum sp. J64-1]
MLSLCRRLTCTSLLIGAFSLSPAWAGEVTLVFTSTMADIEPVADEGSLPQLATLLHKEREVGPTLFLHGGASLAAGVLSSFDKGSHMIDLLNDLQPDAMAVTKRDLAFGEDELTLRSYEARFPFLSANAIDRETGKVLEGLEQDLLLERGGVKIGVVAATSPELTIQYIVPRIEVQPPAQTVTDRAQALREAGAQAVVAIVDNADEDVAELRRNGVVDVLVQVAATGRDSVETDASGAFIVHSNVKGTAVVLRLRHDEAEDSLTMAGEVAQLAGMPAETQMAGRVSAYLDRLSELLDIQVGTTRTALDTRREVIRAEETPFASLVADAMRSLLNADIALINGGSIRGNRLYEAGTPLTRRDIQRELPFRDFITTVPVTGAALREALELSASGVETLKGSFLHPSNMKVVYDLSRPAGSRVERVEIAGKPLDPAAVYKVAMTGYLAKGGDGYAMLAAKDDIPRDDGKLLWEIMAHYISEQGVIAPGIDGRIVLR